jgi:glutathione synthase/RimK-type ligase-like ATP-grasp enzyme
MAAPLILIIAPPDDLHAVVVAKILTDRQQSFEYIDLLNLSQNIQITYKIDGNIGCQLVLASGKVVDSTDILSVWWRRPSLPHLEKTDDQNAEFFLSQWEQFVEHLEIFVQTKWVNSPSNSRSAKVKGRQLILAQQIGLRIPKTLITNDPQEVTEFAATDNPLIYKAMGESKNTVTATQPLIVSDLERLDSLQNCPAIFQERINAQLDIRVTAIGGVLYAVEIESQKGYSKLDWRFDHDVPFNPHILDTVTNNQLQQLLEKLGLVYGAIDLRLTPEGEYVFLEVNPGGQYLFAEILAGVPLSERMADFLMNYSTA